MLRRRTYDPFELVNALFAEMDHGFRDVEKRWHVTLPTISVPGVSYNEDIRTFSDGKIQKTFKNGVLHSVGGEPAIVEFNDKGEILKEHHFWEGERVTKEFVKSKVLEQEDNKEHIVRLGHKEYKVKGKQLKEIEKLLGLEEVK